MEGSIYRGRTPLGAGGTWVRRLGEAAARGGCTSPNSPLGLVVAAARGRQHPAARVAPPQTLVGYSLIVATAQTLSYTIILTISNPITICESLFDSTLLSSCRWDDRKQVRSKV
jgi:hypothetical protein